MTMAWCPLCRGKKEQGQTTYTVDLAFGVVVVRNVPAQICAQCGEEWIDAKTARELEDIVEKARRERFQLGVVTFEEAVGV